MEKLSTLLKDSLIFRIMIAIGLIVMTLLPIFSEPLITIMLSFSLLIVSIDIIIDAVISIKQGNFLNEYLLVSIGSVILFIFNLKIDAIVTVFVFQIALKIISEIQYKHIRSSQKELLESDYEQISGLIDVVGDDNLNMLSIHAIMKKTCDSVFLLSIALAIVFAILMPFIHHLTVSAAIKRAVSIIMISSPMTMIISYRTISTSAIIEAGSNGILLSDIKALDKVNSVHAVILDDNLNYQSSKREIIYSHSDSMSTDSLLNFIYHVIYYSEQDFSKIIKSDLNLEYQNGLVFNHLDIPNYGIKATVNNMRVIFGNDILCRKFGVDVTKEYNENINGDYYFLCIENRCVGCIVLNEGSVINTGEIIDSFNNFHKNCVFFSEFNENIITKKAKLSIFYPENIEKCINYLNYTVSNDETRYDANVLIDFTENISIIPELANRVEEIAKHNSFISFGIKILIIILTILGFTTPWIALFIDFGAAIIILLNSKNLYGKDIINEIMSLIHITKK